MSKKIKTKGIYSILNLKENKYYIGQSRNCENRFLLHIGELNKNKHYNSNLQNDWNKYGSALFEFKIIDKCKTNSELNKKEKYYIKLYDSIDNGYNIQSGGDYKSRRNIGKILQYDLEDNLVKEWNSINEIIKTNPYTRKMILKCISLEIHSYKGYIWKLKSEIIRKSKSYNTCGSKKIYQISLTGEILKLWDSAILASEILNIKYGGILNCASKAKSNIHMKTYKNYIWVWESDYESFNINNYNLNIIGSKENKSSRKINQFTPDGVFVKEWECLKMVELDGFDRCTVIRVCDGTYKTHKGFIFKYKDNK